jgi:hypothetical protein
MSPFKQNLAVGFLVFSLTALAFLGLVVCGVVIDTTLIAAILFLFNAAFHWCGGWAYAGLWKTLSYGFAAALVVRALKLVRLVVG